MSPIAAMDVPGIIKSLLRVQIMASQIIFELDVISYYVRISIFSIGFLNDLIYSFARRTFFYILEFMLLDPTEVQKLVSHSRARVPSSNSPRSPPEETPDIFVTFRFFR